MAQVVEIPEFSQVKEYMKGVVAERNDGMDRIVMIEPESPTLYKVHVAPFGGTEDGVSLTFTPEIYQKVSEGIQEFNSQIIDGLPQGKVRIHFFGPEHENSYKGPINWKEESVVSLMNLLSRVDKEKFPMKLADEWESEINAS